jgi:hypothetical protein
MAYQSLGLGSSANDGTGDDLRTGGDKINDNFVEIYTKLGTGTALTSGISADATTVTLTSPNINEIIFEGSTADANETTLAVADPTADRTITLPDATGTVLLDTQIELANNGSINDDSQNEYLKFTKLASAVNELTIRNAATGGAASSGTLTAPTLEATGGDSNVDLALLPKGTGHVALRSAGGANNQGALRFNCENNTHGQTLMSQPHSASDSGFFMLPLDGGSARATPNVLLSGAKTIAGVQALSGAGAISLNTLHTAVTTTGADALTLANGVNGQIKTISMVADGGNGTLTPTTFANGSTITFNDVGDSVMLIYNTTGGWALISNTGCTIA